MCKWHLNTTRDEYILKVSNMNLCFDFFNNSAHSVLLLYTLVGSSSGWLPPKSRVTKMWQNIIFITLVQIVLPALEFDNFFKPAKVLIKHFSK